MGVAAYNRGSEAIRRGIRQDFARRRDPNADTMLIEENARSRAELQRDRALHELERAKALINRLRAYRRVAGEQAKYDRAITSTLRDHARALSEALQSKRAAHNKLSRIVRNNVSPKTWHEWRQADESDGARS